MKTLRKTLRFFICTLFLFPFLLPGSTPQEYQDQMNLLQQTIDTIIMQSNIDPETAQDLTEKLDILNEIAQANMQQDIKDIHAATALSCFLETATGFLKNTAYANQISVINSFKYSARTNAIHKLIMGAFPGKFSESSFYTDPYTETIGFTLNDWIFTNLFNVFYTALIQQNPNNTAFITSMPQATQTLLIRILAGIAAHIGWTLEKKLLIQKQLYPLSLSQ